MAILPSGGAPADFSYWLGLKYAQLQQHADANTTTANANAALTNAQANNTVTLGQFLAQQQAAAIDNTKADTGLKVANTGVANEQAKVIGPVARAGMQGTLARANLDATQASLLPGETASRIRQQDAVTTGQNLGNRQTQGLIDIQAGFPGYVQRQLDTLNGISPQSIGNGW